MSGADGPSTADDGDFEAHHQLQGAMIDAYEAALLDGASRALAADTLGHLVDFSAVHFAEEERVMAACGYPQLQGHREEHARLLVELRAMEREARLADAEAALAAVHRLRSWLLTHVDGPDRALGAWRLAQRRQPSQTT